MSFAERLSHGLNIVKSSILNGGWRSNTEPVSTGATATSAAAAAGKASTWGEAIAEAEHLIRATAGGSYIEPVRLVGRDLADLTKNIKRLLGSEHPLLDTIAKYSFCTEGKQFRPLVVLLMSQATSIAPKWHDVTTAASTTTTATMDDYQVIDVPFSPAFVLNDDTPTTCSTPHHLYRPSMSAERATILPTQRRLAEITEMIHAASLLHDDVIDASSERRGRPSANASFGNKMAILAGDFLLARASVALARLRNPEVIELLATVIANLVEGEFMQLKNTQSESGRAMTSFEFYMEKTYLKTASLIAKSCRAASVLGGCTREVTDVAYTYGRNLGLAFQLVDDMLDFVVTSTELGKPAGADLKLGLATAPVLYAWEEHPELGPLIGRKFSRKGDVEQTRELVYKSKGLEQTKRLAASHCQKAIAALQSLPDSDAQRALIQLTEKVLVRQR